MPRVEILLRGRARLEQFEVSKSRVCTAATKSRQIFLLSCDPKAPFVGYLFDLSHPCGSSLRGPTKLFNNAPEMLWRSTNAFTSERCSQPGRAKL
jgi:hypothetical protein